MRREVSGVFTQQVIHYLQAYIGILLPDADAVDVGQVRFGDDMIGMNVDSVFRFEQDDTGLS